MEGFFSMELIFVCIAIYTYMYINRYYSYTCIRGFRPS